MTERPKKRLKASTMVNKYRYLYESGSKEGRWYVRSSITGIWTPHVFTKSFHASPRAVSTVIEVMKDRNFLELQAAEKIIHRLNRVLRSVEAREGNLVRQLNAVRSDYQIEINTRVFWERTAQMMAETIPLAAELMNERLAALADMRAEELFDADTESDNND